MKSLSIVKLYHLTGPIIGCDAGQSGVGVQTVFRSYRTFSAEDYSGFYGRLLTQHIPNVATQVSTYLSLIDLPPLVDRNIDSQLHHAHCRCHNRSVDAVSLRSTRNPATTAIELTCCNVLCIESSCRPEQYPREEHRSSGSTICALALADCCVLCVCCGHLGLHPHQRQTDDFLCDLPPDNVAVLGLQFGRQRGRRRHHVGINLQFGDVGCEQEYVSRKAAERYKVRCTLQADL